jgi:Protein of unknown function, DUF547
MKNAGLRLIRIGLMFVAAWLAGCSTLVEIPGERPSSSMAKSQALAAWGRVLSSFVDARGWVDFAGLKAKPDDLHAYVQFIAHTKFEAFTSKDELLAHHINAYNALSMFNVLALGVPASNQSLWARYQFFIARKHQIAGAAMSLYAYENEVIRPLGEPRIHFALNCSAVSCPRLPREPFVAGQLEEQLARETVQFFSDQRHLRVDNTTRQVHVSQILDFFPEDFVPRHAPSIIDYVRRLVPGAFELPSSAYSLRFIPYDWTIANSSISPRTP